MKILQISTHYLPNIGGVETHLNDLVNFLVKKNWQVFVLTYIPLTTNKNAKILESTRKLIILRIPWIRGLFYSLTEYRFLEFLYLLPGLFIISPFIISRYEIIHAHGIIAGFVAVFWGKIFKKKVVISIHSVYHFPRKGLYRNFVYWIFRKSNQILTLSEQSAKEIESLGLSKDKVRVFRYWIDLTRFKAKNSKLKMKKELGLDNKFTVLFVGRLVKEKGLYELLDSAQFWNNNIDLIIVGSGPLEKLVKKHQSKIKTLHYAGAIDQEKLSTYYNAADLLIVPSIHEEGFGRVILESLACGTPIIAANRGAIPEAMDDSVGKLITVSEKNIKTWIEYFYNNPDRLKSLAKNCRKFAERRFSEKNVKTVIDAYREKID